MSNINLSLGQKLREAREAKDMLIEEVAKKLFLSKQRITDIENDDYSRITPSVYLRGYLRLYAKLVDIPEEEVRALELPDRSEQGPNMFSAKITVEEYRATKGGRYVRWFNLLFLLLLLILVIIWWHDSNISAQDRQSFKEVVQQIVLPTPIR